MGRYGFYGISSLRGCIFFGIFFVVPILGELWVLLVGKGDLDLGLWCVLDIDVLVWFFIFDVGFSELLRNCDNIGLCEGISQGKGFGYDDEVCC